MAGYGRSRALPVYVVTGATGWVGRHVVRHLTRRGRARVLALVRLRRDQDLDQRARWLRDFAGADVDVAPLDAGSPIILPAETNSIIHCAGGVSQVEAAGFMTANVLLTWQLLLAAAHLPALRTFVHTSTLLVRGNSESPFSEGSLDSGQEFVSPYVYTKHLAEVMVTSFPRLRSLPRSLAATTARIGTVLPGCCADDPLNADWLFHTVKLWLTGRLAVVPLPRETPLFPIAADHLAEALCTVADERTAPRVVHLPYVEGPSIGEVFDTMGAAVGREAPVLVCADSPVWTEARSRLPAAVRRLMTLLYPEPPPGTALATVVSEATQKWFESVGVETPVLHSDYWRALVRRWHGI